MHDIATETAAMHASSRGPKESPMALSLLTRRQRASTCLIRNAHSFLEDLSPVLDKRISA